MLSADQDDEDGFNRSLCQRVLVNRALLYLKSDYADAHNASYDLEQASLMSPHDTDILHTKALSLHRFEMFCIFDWFKVVSMQYMSREIFIISLRYSKQFENLRSLKMMIY